MLDEARDVPLSAAQSDLQVRSIGPPIWERTTTGDCYRSKTDVQPQVIFPGFWGFFSMGNCASRFFPRKQSSGSVARAYHHIVLVM